MIEERYELALDRIRLMQTEDTVKEPYRDYFKKMAEFVLMLDELRDELLDGRYQKLTLEELRTWNRRLYQDVLPEQYEESYANPDYACKMFGKESGQILGMLYAELRGAVVYVFEGKTEYLAILYELLIEIYNQFEDTPDAKTARDIFYWYASDYCDVFLADRIREQILPEESFATDLIMNSDLKDLRYLYQFGEYISTCLSDMLINTLGSVLVFAASYIVIHLVIRWLNLLSRLPIICGLNQMAGGIVGLAEGFLLLWLAGFILSFFTETPMGQMLEAQVNSSIWLSLIYRYNLMNVILGSIINGIL